jgi:hypothetical protein
LIGIGGQFDNNSPFLEGYQLLPRYMEDIQDADCDISQPPMNDECTSAFAVDSLLGGAIGETLNSALYTNTDATVSDNEPGNGYECFGEPDGGGSDPSVENTVWFSFTGDGNTYFIETNNCNGEVENYIPDGDTQISIYSGLCAISSPEACNEDGPNATPGNFEAGLTFETVAGQNYLMMIDGFAGAQGEFCFSFTALPPANDECGEAVDITDLVGGDFDVPQTSGSYTNVGASSVDDPNPNDVTANCWFGDPLISQTVWFSFTGDGGEYFIETVECGEVTDYIDDGDTQMAIFTGDCGDFTQVACNEDGPQATGTEFPAGITLMTEPDEEYYVMVDGYQNADGEFCMQMTQNMPDGIEEFSAFDFTVYPNPSNGFVFVESDEIVEAAMLMDVTGKQVAEWSFTASQRVELNLESVSSGIYVLQLRNGRSISTTRLVVE